MPLQWGESGPPKLTAQTGRDTSASIRLDVEHRAGRRARVRVETVGVDGRRWFGPSSKPTIEFVNYVVFAAAVPGPHRLRFELEEAEGLGIRVGISPQSGLAATSLSPRAWAQQIPRGTRPDLRFTRRQRRAVASPGRMPAVRCRSKQPGDGPASSEMTTGQITGIAGGLSAALALGFGWRRRRLTGR